mmetsp:Transcript_20888/g.80220  ORF Transcript_20888/g.80220 Transcript_20888/m.80220 type:complete len:375 (-) Transcript_20888:24-1148(-)
MTADARDDDSTNALPAGTRFGELEILGTLGVGGFGIVYLATDIALERQVAIKEYLPSSMAERAAEGLTVQVKSAAHAETFAIGLRSFVNEAKLLAHFDHPALLKVHQFWEENGTAYMAMPYYQGQTLKAALARLGRLPTEREVRAWLMPLLDALEVMHEEQCYHRDIAPDNILLTDQGPLLLDFGAARRVIGDMTQALTVILKPGYAPIEQHAEVPGMKQGPWTDVYALAAVVYWAITDRTPPPSVGRLLKDEHVPLAQLTSLVQERYSARLIQAVDRALQVLRDDRTPSMAAFREDLGLAGEFIPTPSRMQDELGGLMPEMRKVLLLVAMDDMSYEEAAALLSVPIGTVRSRVSRARTHLRTRLKARGAQLPF